jgi:hypothetical protein
MQFFSDLPLDTVVDDNKIVLYSPPNVIYLHPTVIYSPPVIEDITSVKPEEFHLNTGASSSSSIESLEGTFELPNENSKQIMSDSQQKYYDLIKHQQQKISEYNQMILQSTKTLTLEKLIKNSEFKSITNYNANLAETEIELFRSNRNENSTFNHLDSSSIAVTNVISNLLHSNTGAQLALTNFGIKIREMDRVLLTKSSIELNYRFIKYYNLTTFTQNIAKFVKLGAGLKRFNIFNRLYKSIIIFKNPISQMIRPLEKIQPFFTKIKPLFLLANDIINFNNKLAIDNLTELVNFLLILSEIQASSQVSLHHYILQQQAISKQLQSHKSMSVYQQLTMQNNEIKVYFLLIAHLSSFINQPIFWPIACWNSVLNYAQTINVESESLTETQMNDSTIDLLSFARLLKEFKDN